MDKTGICKTLTSFVTVIVLSVSCIEQFTPDLKDGYLQQLLVVEGQITNEIGPFKVRLTNSVSVYSDPNILNKDHPVYGADVQIYDDKGNTFDLYEGENGWYETENKQLKGIIGNTYTLNFATSDGKQYESSPVRMLNTPDIESIHFDEIQRTHFDEKEPYDENWLNILVDCKRPVDENIYLRWEFEETWMFVMPLYISVDHGTGPGAPPASMETIDIDDKKKTCWVTEPSREILVESPVAYQGNRVRNFVLQTIGPSSDRLNIKYSMLVKQFGISREFYSLFKKLREANKESGGIYSKMPGQVFGNITCCNSGEKALGYFFASAVKTRRVFIDRFEHDVSKGSAYGSCGWTTDPSGVEKVYLYGIYEDENGIDQKVWSTSNYCTDCRKRGPNVKPDFWED